VDNIVVVGVIAAVEGAALHLDDMVDANAAVEGAGEEGAGDPVVARAAVEVAVVVGVDRVVARAAVEGAVVVVVVDRVVAIAAVEGAVVGVLDRVAARAAVEGAAVGADKVAQWRPYARYFEEVRLIPPAIRSEYELP
jgi:hypothetical protein